MFVGTGGSALIGSSGFDLPTANTISGNGFLDPVKGGIFAFLGGAIDVRNATITGNDGAGVQAFENGFITLRNSTVKLSATHGVTAFLRSTVRLRDGSAIRNNPGDGVRIGAGSAVDFRSGVVTTVTESGGFGLECFGDEASFSGNTSGIASAPSNASGAISPGCTGF
ncbi:MAG: right-handed parallel beta-helix repeat-containing protein [Candidatus Methylomirabilales bacterium]